VAYLNVDEIESALENLAGAYPAATQLITVPHRTHEGRVSHVLRLGAAASGRDGVLILGGVHAREWVPPDALIAWPPTCSKRSTSAPGWGTAARASQRATFVS
jgi:hypothetical protein